MFINRIKNAYKIVINDILTKTNVLSLSSDVFVFTSLLKTKKTFPFRKIKKKKLTF